MRFEWVRFPQHGRLDLKCIRCADQRICERPDG
nr:MAG TPA: hypothetical protein [Bacteriophage sp.]